MKVFFFFSSLNKLIASNGKNYKVLFKNKNTYLKFNKQELTELK